MSKTFHLSIGVVDIDEEVEFFKNSLNGRVTHHQLDYTNIEIFEHQITLKPEPDIRLNLKHFHFGFNMNLDQFGSISDTILSNFPSYVQMEPQTVDAGTKMERRKMYLTSPTGYLVELKGYN